MKMSIENLLSAEIKKRKQSLVNGEYKNLIITRCELFEITHILPQGVKDLEHATKIYFEFSDIELYLSIGRPDGPNMFCICKGNCELSYVANQFIISELELDFRKR